MHRSSASSDEREKQGPQLTRLREALDVMPDATVAVNREGCIVQVNEAAARLFGYGADELSGQSIEILVPDRLRDAHTNHRSRFQAAPSRRSMGSGEQLLARRKDGSEFLADISFAPWKALEGVVIAAIRDRTREIDLERDHLEAEAMYRTLVEQCGDIVIILQDQKVVYSNKAYKKVLGWENGEVEGQSFFSGVAPKDRDRVRDYHLRRMRGETAPDCYEIDHLTKDGRYVPVEIRPRTI